MLPLKVSQPAEITRVMVGRIELVTPEQRKLLAQIANAPASDPLWLYQARQANPKLFEEVRVGSKPISALGLSMPKDFQAYVNLGRFRDALLLDALKREAKPGLNAFARTYRLPGERFVPERW